MKTIPAGITWHRLTNDTSLVTIRREPEVVYELSDFTHVRILRDTGRPALERPAVVS
jgi:hypothetical protein